MFIAPPLEYVHGEKCLSYISSGYSTEWNQWTVYKTEDCSSGDM